MVGALNYSEERFPKDAAYLPNDIVFTRYRRRLPSLKNEPGGLSQSETGSYINFVCGE